MPHITSWRSTATSWAGALTLGAAVIHFAGALGQPVSSTLLEQVLLACAVIQTAAAAALLLKPNRTVLVLAAGLNAAGVFIWIAVRWIGLRVGADIWKPETLGTPDYYLPAMQLLAAMLCASAPVRHRSIMRYAPIGLTGLVVLGGVITYVLYPAATLVSLVNLAMIAGVPVTLLPGVVLTVASIARRQLRPLAPALLVVVPVTFAGASVAATRGWFPENIIQVPPPGQTQSMVYCTQTGGAPLVMDVTEPTPQSHSAPAIVYVHGGAGFLGSRDFANDVEGNYFRQLRDDLSHDGFVVASIDYGFIPLHSLTDMVEDARCAVRFLRAHAQTLHVNPERIGIYGDSEGGYVAAMLGTTGDAHPDSRVQAVADLWGFTDLADFSGSPSWVASIGAASRSGKAAAAANSPLDLVHAGDPPFLIVHGADDWFIAPHHSQKLAQQLTLAGVPTTLVMIQNDAHGIAASSPGQTENPSPESLIATICAFFERTLAA